MKINQKLYDKYGNELIIKSIKNNKYVSILMHRKYYRGEQGLTRDSITPKEVIFSDTDLGVLYFFEKDDIGNRYRLLAPNGPYYFNKSNIEKQFDQYLSELKEYLPYGPLIFDEAGRQEVINSFFDEKESIKEKDFLSCHPLCFGRIDLDSRCSVGHDKKYFDEHFHDTLYISKSSYHRYGNVQVVNWRADIATLYYEKSVLHKHSLDYLDVLSEDRGSGTDGLEYDFSVMLRRSLSSSPYSSQTTYVCGSPTGSITKEDKQISEMKHLYKDGGIDPFLLKIIEEKRLENKLTDIITTIQANQNEMIRHTPKKNMIVQGCAGSGKTMILLHRISYLKYNNLLRNFQRAVIIVPNLGFNIFINELSSNLEIEQIPRYTMSQYYLKLISMFQKKIYSDAKEKDTKLLKTLENIRELEFTNGNITTSSELFNDELEYDICDFYDQFFSQFTKDIEEDKIKNLAEYFQISIGNENTGASKLNTLFNCVTRIDRVFHEKTKNEKQELEEAKKQYNNTKIPEKHIRTLTKHINNLFDELGFDSEKSFCQVLQTINPRKALEEKYNALLAEQNELERKIKSEARGFLRFNSVGNEDKQKLDAVKTQIKEIEEQIEKVIESADEPENYIKIKKVLEGFRIWRSDNIFFCKKIEPLLNEYDRLINRLQSEKVSFRELSDEFNMLIQNMKNSDAIKAFKQNLMKTKENYDSICDSIMSPGEREVIKQAYQKLENHTEIVKVIFEKYTKIKYDKIESARHLFILLALYFLHVGKISTNTDFIFIDEAQDYSDIEFRLLRGILDDKTVFEAYGDCMQQITPNRGISDWSQLKILLGDDYYEMRENYRNTVEVANFINSRIKNVFSSIGFHGDEVKLLYNGWVEQALREIKNDSKKRVAIICKNQDVLFNYNMSKIPTENIFTVIEAKGLEFESVYVIERNMTDSERYIAFSRALQALYVVNY